MMKIILKVYKGRRLGNFTTYFLDIPHNKITVRILKKIIFLQLGIKPTFQRLTYQSFNGIMIILTDDYPLFYFNINNYSVVYLENLENHGDQNAERGPISKKYMNKPRYFHEDQNKCHSSSNLTKVEVNSSDANSDSEKNNINLSDDEQYKKYKNKNNKADYNNLDLVSIGEKKITNKGTTPKDDKQLNEKLIKLIKKKDFPKIKHFFKELDLVIKNDAHEQKKHMDSMKTRGDDDEDNLQIEKDLSFCEILDENGWNPIHYIAYYGYYDILNFMINNVKIQINFNIPNKEGYSPLILATFKQHLKCVELLLTIHNIDLNYLGPTGSALHIACKKNNIKIVSLLLLKGDLTLLDKEEKIPLEYTTNHNIKKLISKVVYHKLKKISDRGSQTYKYLSKFITKYKHLLIEQKKDSSSSSGGEKYEFLKKIAQFPMKPTIVHGEVEKSGKLLKIYRKRFLELNPALGLLRRYPDMTFFPDKPNGVTPLRDVIKCEKIPMFFKDGNEFCFTLLIKQEGKKEPLEEKYMVHNSQAYEKWVDMINRNISYAKFWDKVKLTFKNPKDNVEEYLKEQKYDTMEIDSFSGEFKLFDVNGKQKTLKKTLGDDEENEEEDENDSFDKNNNIFDIENNLNNNQTNQKQNAAENEKIETLIEDSSKKEGITFDSFEILSLLGAGSFGKVCKVKMKSTGKIYAMKILNKDFLTKHDMLNYAIAECNVLKKASSPFIITLHYAFQTPDNLYMIIDYCPGGDLDTMIQIRIFEESEAQFYIAELLLAIEYLHTNKILYSDLKPENILIYSDGHIKLADFGLARENIADGKLKSFGGSSSYLSKEMIQKGESSSDIYGIGAVLYEMLCGHSPFFGKDSRTMHTNIASKKLIFPEFFSDSARDLIKKLMEKNPQKRIELDDIKKHKFFRGIEWEYFDSKNVKIPLDLIKIKQKYYAEKGNEKIIDNNEIKNENLKKELKDSEYNENNKFDKRISNFTFAKDE